MNRSFQILLMTALLAACGVLLGSSVPSSPSQTAEKTDLFSTWRPNDNPRGIHYVGSKACVACHPVQAKQLETPMAQALEVAPDCGILSGRSPLKFQIGSFSYELSRQGKNVIYTVTDGVNKISEPILYCFGQGHVGQTYLFRHNDTLYETRVSYFQKLRSLDFTIGHRRAVPNSLDEALGRPIGGEEPQQCFGCHSTGSVRGFELRLDQLSPGVGCEACHGPGEKHIAAARARRLNDLQIFNPGNLGAAELTQSFCGTCHTSFDQAMVMPGQSGINNIRFQPYRMFNSPGHNTNDVRISCLACHDPHEKVQTAISYYDSKCLACHRTTPKDRSTARRFASACPVSIRQCVSCHMPKVELPEMHAKFTDHWIRIVKGDEATPR